MKAPYTCLWFENQALEAAEFYCSLFDNSKIISQNGFMAQFELNGQKYMTMNGGPKYKLSHAASIVVECETQAEIDQYWAKLTDGGEEGRCGWLTDKFGLSWQIIPSKLASFFADPEKAERVQEAFSKMNKIDIAILENC